MIINHLLWLLIASRKASPDSLSFTHNFRGTHPLCTYLLAVVLVAVIIIMLEAIFCGQAKQKLANNTERLVILIEWKCIQTKMTIFISKLDLKRISSTNDVLKSKFLDRDWRKELPS